MLMNKQQATGACVAAHEAVVVHLDIFYHQSVWCDMKELEALLLTWINFDPIVDK